MATEYTTYHAHNISYANGHEFKGVVVDYPKSEPVLEGSYIFPKVAEHDNWKFETSGTLSISTYS